MLDSVPTPLLKCLGSGSSAARTEQAWAQALLLTGLVVSVFGGAALVQGGAVSSGSNQRAVGKCIFWLASRVQGLAGSRATHSTDTCLHSRSVQPNWGQGMGGASKFSGVKGENFLWVKGEGS